MYPATNWAGGQPIHTVFTNGFVPGINTLSVVVEQGAQQGYIVDPVEGRIGGLTLIAWAAVRG